MSPLDALATKLGVTRNRDIIVPCSGCGIGCNPVREWGAECFCVSCYAKERTKKEGDHG